METVMLQFRQEGPAPTLDDVARTFDLAPEELDAQFGVIATDPTDGLYTVLISAEATERVGAVLASRSDDPAEGIFSNTRVEPTTPNERPKP